ncbi:MAG TPA: ATP-binding protein [Candidatus Saccharimonadales bacterium]|nr:ATP-binding protein [Candidatus Saccharimonadales bacterium]
MTNLALILVVVAIVNFTLGGVVFSRKPRDKAAQTFLGLTGGLGLWGLGISFYLLSGDMDRAAFYSNIYYFAAMLMATSLYLFSVSQSHRQLSSWHYLHWLVPVGWLIGVIISPRLLVNFSINDLSHVAISPVGYAVYSAITITYFVAAIVILARGVANTVDHWRRRQLLLVSVSAVLVGVVAITFNLLLPALGIYYLVWVGPLYSIVFALSAAYAVERYKMFDLRATLAKTLAYLLALIVVVLVYTSVLLAVGLRFFGGVSASRSQDLIYIALAILLAVTFQPLKNFFNRITSRLFFNLNYSPEQVIQEFGDAMLGSVELGGLAEATFSVLNRTLAPADLALIISDDSAATHFIRVSTSTGDGLSRTVVRHLAQSLSLPRYRRRLIIDSQELFESRDLTLKSLFDDNAVNLAVKLQTKDRQLGYLLVGYRQNGAGYGSSDMYILRTVGDELALAIENGLQFKQINRFNRTLKERVDSATSKLRQNNRQLLQLDEAKDEFISMASHQLRTPLTTVKGYLSMLMEGDAGKLTRQQQKLTEEAFNSSQRMVFLINDFLNVSRLQTGRFELEKRPVDLGEVLTQEIGQLQVMAKSRQMKLDCQADKSLPLMELDETKLRQVMMNFVDNAIYYSSSGSTIAISLKLIDHAVEFKVTDHGIGVPKNEQAGLFGKFYRASNARKQRPDGTGVGLYMAKKVIDAHDGQIIFSSQQGKGSTFGFRLPLINIDL